MTAQKTILIVEDETVVAVDLRNILEAGGYVVTAEVPSGVAAIQMAAEQRPDIVLMDVLLPGEIDGIQAAESIRATLDIPVIYLTGYSEDAILHRAKLTEPYGFLIKPVSARELISAIEMALYKHDSESSFKEREERYRIIADFTYDWEFWLGNDGKFLYVSPSCERITGYRPEDFFQDPSLLLKMAHPDDRERLSGHCAENRTRRDSHLSDFRIITKDGETRWIGHACRAVYSRTGEYLGRRASNRDISDRKAAEIALRESEERYRSLVELAPDGIILSVEGTVVFANSAAVRLLRAQDPEAIIGKAVTDFVHPDFRDLTIGRMQQMQDVRATAPLVEEKFIGLDGSVVEVEVALSCFKHRGQFAVQTVLRDITERKRAETLVLKTAKIRAVADLAAGVAHNFNNWLQIIMVASHLAAEQVKGRGLAQVLENLEQIIETCHHASATVKRLQSFAGLRAPIRRDGAVFDLSETVLHAIDITQLWWKTVPRDKGFPISLTSDLPKGCTVSGNENELFEVAVSLIKNAIEAIPLGGEIHVETCAEEDRVLLRVRDNGPGIPEKHLGRIFEPFFTTKGFSTAGMGLASAYGIASRHGGEILVKS